MTRSEIIKVLVVLTLLFITGLVAYFLLNPSSSLAPVTSEQGGTEESDTLSDAKELETIESAEGVPKSLESAVMPDETDTPAADPLPSDEADESESNDDETEELEEPEEPTDEEEEAEPVVCTADVKECSDGSIVGRVAPSCAFAACPVVCTADVKECSDGSIVGRVAPSCAFAACPVTPQLQLAPQPVSCTADVKECSDGSFVGRVAPGCEFAACPVQQFQFQMN